MDSGRTNTSKHHYCRKAKDLRNAKENPMNPYNSYKYRECNNPAFDKHDTSLLCPRCKSNHTHQGKVEVFDREQDADTGQHTTCNRCKVRIDTIMDGNPSPRRHGVSIQFMCEICSGEFTIFIAQHKGQTFISTDYQ